MEKERWRQTQTDPGAELASVLGPLRTSVSSLTHGTTLSSSEAHCGNEMKSGEAGPTQQQAPTLGSW